MLTDEQGAKAIIDLQKMAGVDEPEERAKEAWANFSHMEKVATEQAWTMFCNEGGGGRSVNAR